MPPDTERPPEEAPLRQRNVFWLGIVSFFIDSHSEAILAILPLFLANVLRVPKTAIGAIDGLADAAAAVLKALSGWMSDRLRRRKGLALLGYGISTVSKPLLALATAWSTVMAVRFADRVGKGIRTAPRDALLAASASTTRRGRAFGFHRAMDTLGAVVGSAAGWWLLDLFGAQEKGYRMVFLVATIGGIIALITLAAAVREIAPPPLQPGAPAPWLSLAGLDRRLRMFLVAHGLFSLGQFTYMFVLLRAQDLGVDQTLVPGFYLFYNVIYAAFAYPAGGLSDRFGRRAVLLATYAAWGITCAGLALARNATWVWPMFVIWALHSASVNPVTRAIAADLSPAEKRGTGLGVFHLVDGGMALPASLLAGLLWDLSRRGALPFWPATGVAATALPFWVAAGLTVAALPLAAIALRSLVPSPKT